MAKFTLVPAATFEHPVMIPQPGAEDAELVMTFKHLTLEELRAAEDKSQKEQAKAKEKGYLKGQFKAMADFILLIAEGWELEQPMDRAHLVACFANYPRWFEAVTIAYARELWCLRQKP